jgi:tetrameric-type glycyl-tRNA synthetase beta subunit
MPKLLLEIGCEELPAAACREAAEQLPALVEEQLGAAPSETYVGPRRIAFVVAELPARTADEWVKGPPENLRDKAAAGFAKRYGVEVDALVVRDGFLGVEVAGKAIAEVLPERLAALVQGFQFGKSMSWGPGFRFARPVRWVCAKLDDETVPVTLEGVPSGGVSYGHRFTHPGPVEIASADTYLAALRGAGVEPDAAARRAGIEAALGTLGSWSDPGGKLDEVVYLVEAARVQEGRFDERFTDLPRRVIETTMQSHQRYFPLGGNRFGFVANGGDPDVVRAGNEFVLSGRLEDAEFTYRRDVEVGIETLAGRLGAITYIKGAGSLADKQERLADTVGQLGGDEVAREAAQLAKADLASELVREFTDLQGHIGAHYARLAGRSEEVAAAIDEQYLPDAAGGQLPATQPGRVLAAADKLDTLRTAFGLGLKPSGSRDPYGLRRAAIGLCRLASEGGVAVPRSALGEAREFVEERLEGLLDVPVEYVRAARASSAAGLAGVAALAETLYAARDTSDFDAVYTAYERANRLAGKAAAEAAPARDAALLTEPAERDLASALDGATIEPNGDLSAAAALAPHVNRFFDDVLVMAEDDRVRANRLRLLLDVRDAIGRLGDFSQIPR